MKPLEYRPAIGPAVELDNPMEDSVSHSLSVLSSIYHYNHWIFTMIMDHLGRSVLEVGAGVGNITRFMLNLDRIVCLEPSENYCSFLRQSFSKHLNVEIHRMAIEDCPNASVREGSFESIVCLNVLEHIADDVGALAKCRSLLAPNGRMIVLVPALPILYGGMDRAMGHIRRYTRRSLASAFCRAGLRPGRGRYMNSVGALGWFVQGRLMRHSTISEKGTRLFDRMVPYIAAGERIIPPLLGQSLVMVGEREE